MFSIRDYVLMYKKEGLRLPIKYFREAHWFDLRRGITTHSRVPVSEISRDMGISTVYAEYRVAWSSAIKFAFYESLDYLGNRFNEHTFFDLGSGKGKVICQWTELLRKEGLKQDVVGIEFNSTFAQLSQENHKAMFGSEGNINILDVTKFDFAPYKKVILFMFNPFGPTEIKKVLRNISNVESCIVIYNNPIHQEVFDKETFKILKSRESWHANERITIFERI